MKVSSLTDNVLYKRLSGSGLRLRMGPFVSCIQSPVVAIAQGIKVLYAEYPVAEKTDFVDFNVCLRSPRNMRRWFGRQILFLTDGYSPFKPLPLTQALPVLEWGLNWCISSRIHDRLLVHAAVIEKNGSAIIMPGTSGSGKSTLCAALVSRGWRLLSDELTLLCPRTGHVEPLPRPISLKNASIGVLQDFAPQMVMGPVSDDTSKGTVAHLRVPAHDVERALLSSRPAWVVFPKYVPKSVSALTSVSKGRAGLDIIHNAFNYSVLGEVGFQILLRLLEECQCFAYRYSVLDEAVATFDNLVNNKIVHYADEHG